MGASTSSGHLLDWTTRKHGLTRKTFGKSDVFTVEDKARLYRCCASLIEDSRRRHGGNSGGGVTKFEILSRVKAAGPNFSDLLRNYTASQICNRVRCEIRKKSSLSHVFSWL